MENTNLLTIHQVAKILNVHTNTLRNWDNQGKLTAVRLGARGDRRYRKDDIDQLTKTRLWKHKQDTVTPVAR